MFRLRSARFVLLCSASLLALTSCGTPAKDYLTSLQHRPTYDAQLRRLPNTDSGLPRGIVLHWFASQFFWGVEELALHVDGTLYYYYEPAEGSGGSSVDVVTRYPVEQLDELERVMKRHGFCELESKRKGIVDEAKPSLAVRLGELDCAVSLWDGEWRDLPAAAAAAAVLKPLMEELH